MSRICGRLREVVAASHEVKMIERSIGHSIFLGSKSTRADIVVENNKEIFKNHNQRRKMQDDLRE